LLDSVADPWHCPQGARWRRRFVCQLPNYHTAGNLAGFLLLSAE
jgi:hypothetical protein